MKIPDYIKGTLSNALNDPENRYLHLVNLAEMLRHWENSDLKGAEIDNPEWDGTDGAHPAYYRGHEDSAKQFCKMATEILDGKPVTGVSKEPWETFRKRLSGLVGREFYRFVPPTITHVDCPCWVGEKFLWRPGCTYHPYEI